MIYSLFSETQSTIKRGRKIKIEPCLFDDVTFIPSVASEMCSTAFYSLLKHDVTSG